MSYWYSSLAIIDETQKFSRYKRSVTPAIVNNILGLYSIQEGYDGLCLRIFRLRAFSA